MSLRIRPAVAEDAAGIEQIEEAADQLLVALFRATDWPAPDAAAERLALPGYLLLAEYEGTPAGFVHVLDLDGHAHLEQVSVLPRYLRRGIGRILVRAAMEEAARRGHDDMTLRTYADVPWNAPFYASCGFSETEPDSGGAAQSRGRGGAAGSARIRPPRADDGVTHRLRHLRSPRQTSA
jgi:GNAT superfamily N-acetyltransferase